MRVRRWWSRSDGPRYWRGFLDVVRDDGRGGDLLSLRADVAVLDKAVHAGFSVEEDGDTGGVQVFVGLWRLVDVWLTAGSPALMGWQYRRRQAKGLRYKYRPELNLVSLRFFDRAVWWEVWHPKHEWHRGTPLWRHGNFNVWDWLVGKAEHSREVLAERDAIIQLPEGSYRCRVTLDRRVWTRKRWRALEVVGYDVELAPRDDGRPGYVPIPGKGENSWDLGPDGLYSSSGPLPAEFQELGRVSAERGSPLETNAVAWATGRVAGSVLDTRRRRGAQADYAEPIT